MFDIGGGGEGGGLLGQEVRPILSGVEIAAYDAAMTMYK